MILPISNFRLNNIRFKAENNINKEDTGSEANSAKEEHDTLMPNNVVTRARIGMDKVTKAFSIYPAKGLKGSINSNFYEFLTMGTVPFIIGSGMMMAVFNGVTNKFNHNAVTKAAKLGNKMALGVLLYAGLKDLTKFLTTAPIKWFTGIDTELPYSKVNYFLKENPDSDSGLTSIEYHKVGESVDFPRWDQLYGDTSKGEPINFRYDKIAKKNGLGENLNDSDQDVKPMYKEVLVKSKLAKSFSSFMWAVTGVALAFQKPWDDFFNVATLKFWKGKDFVHSMKTFGRSFLKSVKSLYVGPSGEVSKLDKHSGKALLATTLLTTILGVVNSLHITKKPKKTNSQINPNKESVVC